ncbi:MAG: hypothetical protein ACH350_03995 [Parachlamydiaceae bacterium]
MIHLDSSKRKFEQRIDSIEDENTLKKQCLDPLDLQPPFLNRFQQRAGAFNDSNVNFFPNEFFCTIDEQSSISKRVTRIRHTITQLPTNQATVEKIRELTHNWWQSLITLTSDDSWNDPLEIPSLSNKDADFLKIQVIQSREIIGEIEEYMDEINQKHQFYVSLTGRKINGIAICSQNSCLQTNIDYLVTAPWNIKNFDKIPNKPSLLINDCKRMVGTELIKNIIKHSNSNIITLNSTDVSSKFYKNLGFQETPVDDYSNYMTFFK